MKNQPLAWCGFSLLAGLLAASWGIGQGGMVILFSIAVVLALTAVGFAIWLHDSRKKTLLVILFTLTFSFTVLPVWELLAYQPVVKLDGQSVYITGEIIDRPQKNGNRYIFTLKTDEIDSEGAPQKTRLRVTTYQYVQAFDRIQGQFSLVIPPISRGFDAKSYYKAKGIYLDAYSEGVVERTAADGFSLTHLPLQIRNFSLSLIDDTFQPSEAALIKGILLGDTTDIPQESKESFQNSGLAHILAVSGTHTVIIAQLLLSLFLLMRIKKRPACFMAAGFILIFMAITGFTPSVTRAGLMSILMLLGQGFYRQTSPLNSLGFSLMVMLLVNPFAVADIGLLLSFSATLGIIVFAPEAAPLQAKLATKLPKPLQNPFSFLSTATLQSLFASLAVIPVSILAFSSLSVVAPFSNLVASVTFQPILVFGLLTLLLAALPFGHILALPFAVVTALFTKLLSLIASFFGGLPFAALPAGDNMVRYVVIMVFVFLIVTLLTGLFKKRKLLCLFAAMLILLSGWTVNTLLENQVTRIAVFADEKDGGVIISSADSTVIIQSGKDIYLSHEMADYLLLRGVSSLQLYIGTNQEYTLDSNPLMTELICQYAALPVVDADNDSCNQILLKDKPIQYDFGNDTSLTIMMRGDCYYVFLKQGSQTVLISDYPYLTSFTADFLILPSAETIQKLEISPSIPSVLLADNGLPVKITGHKLYPAETSGVTTIKIKSNKAWVIE